MFSFHHQAQRVQVFPVCGVPVCSRGVCEDEDADERHQQRASESVHGARGSRCIGSHARRQPGHGGWWHHLPHLREEGEEGDFLKLIKQTLKETATCIKIYTYAFHPTLDTLFLICFSLIFLFVLFLWLLKCRLIHQRVFGSKITAIKMCTLVFSYLVMSLLPCINRLLLL